MNLITIIKTIIENHKKTMNQCTIECQTCKHYSFQMINGGLAKKQYCQKYHKETQGNCPDYEYDIRLCCQE